MEWFVPNRNHDATRALPHMTALLLIRTDPLSRVQTIKAGCKSHWFSRRSQEMIAVAFVSFSVLVVAWFVAPSRAAAAE